MTELATESTTADPAGGFSITVTDKYHGTVDQQGLDAGERRQAGSALALLTEALRGDAMVELLTPWIEESNRRARKIFEESNGEWGPPVESVFDVRGLTFDEF